MPLWPPIVLILSVSGILLFTSMLAGFGSFGRLFMGNQSALSVYLPVEGRLVSQETLTTNGENIIQSLLSLRDIYVAESGREVFVDVIEGTEYDVVRVILVHQDEWEGDLNDPREGPAIVAALSYTFLQPLYGGPWVDALEIVFESGELFAVYRRDELYVESL